MAMADLKEGQLAYSADGEKLGKIVRIAEESVIIEKGFFLPQDFACSRSDVADVRDDKVYLSLTKAQLEAGARAAGVGGSNRGADSPAIEREVPAGSSARGASTLESEVRVPVVEEEVSVQKRAREAGKVRVSKHVVTEQKTLTVPVLREEVRVERVAGTSRPSEEAILRDDSVTVPVMEEEVIVTKRPIVREEVRIKKSQRLEQRAVQADVRREAVEIDQEPEESEQPRLREDDGAAPHA
ncbi:MAG: hypothetical protein NVS2B6_20320 [Thermoleophilaceae bacterium]